MKKTNIVHNTLAESVKLVEAQKLHELIKSKDCDQETLKTAIQNFGKMYINATYLVPDTINEYFASGLDKHATLLTTAVKSENLPAAELLIKFNANVSHRPLSLYRNLEDYPINIAAETDNMGLIQLLLDNGSNITYSSINSAINNNNERALKLFLQTSASKRGQGSKMPTEKLKPLLKTAVNHNNIEISTLLFEFGAQLTKSIFKKAMTSNSFNKELVKSLLEHKNDIKDFNEFVSELASDLSEDKILFLNQLESEGSVYQELVGAEDNISDNSI